jgi:hypothetical protein
VSVHCSRRCQGQGKKNYCCYELLTLEFSAIVTLTYIAICHYLILKGNSDISVFVVVKGIEGCNIAEMVLKMYRPEVTIVGSKTAVDEVNLNVIEGER